VSQLDTQSKVIDGVTYRVAMLDPLAANDLLVDLMHVVGPSLGAGAGAFAGALGGGEGALDTKADPEMLDRAISGFFERVTKAKMRETIAVLAKVTTVEIGGKTPCLETILAEHFRGRLGKMYEWLAFAIQAELGDFFDLAERAIAGAAPLVQAAVSPSRSSPSTTDEPPT
jgi:hypothetical protein